MEDALNEKQNQLDEYQGMEEVQMKMEELINDNQQKQQVIEELQHQLQNGPIEDGEEGQGYGDVQAQLEAKDQEIRKLEELIENFKELYQHMLDEKQVIMEENEKLTNENNQFREIFSVRDGM